MRRPRGRPRGSTGPAAILSEPDVVAVLGHAQSRTRLSNRSLAILAISIGLGRLAGEIARLRWSDIFTDSGVVLVAPFPDQPSKRKSGLISSHKVHRILTDYWNACRPGDLTAPLFPSQKGGHMTRASLARFLRQLYRGAGLKRAGSRSGRRTCVQAALCARPLPHSERRFPIRTVSER